MLEIRLLMDSPTGEVLAFKTCCGLKLQDQNLEILVTNRGVSTVVLKSLLELETENGPVRITNLLPQPTLEVPPGETRAFYCHLDERVWKRARRASLFDTGAKTHSVDLRK